MNETKKRRSAISIMGSLIGLVKPLLHIMLDVRAYLEIQPQFQFNKITRERVRLSCEYRNHECAESDQ